MKMSIKILGVTALLMSCLISTAFAQDPNVLARIGNKTITVADFNKILNYYDAEQRATIEKNPQAKTTILWQTVQGMVIAALAREKGFDKRPEIKGQLEMINNNFLAFQYLQKEVISKIQVTEKEAKAYYDKNPDLFKTPEQVKARHILIQVSKDASDEEKKKAKEKADELLKKVKAGEDFTKLAAEYSDDPGTKSKGGELGLFSKGSMVPAFEQAAFSLKPGEVSDLVETEFGFHVIKVDEKKEAVSEPFESIKERVTKQVLREKQEAKVTEFVEQALKKAKVSINPGALNAK
jgi:peptidyl-prolyl cis-trans isomerase C